MPVSREAWKCTFPCVFEDLKKIEKWSFVSPSSIKVLWYLVLIAYFIFFNYRFFFIIVDLQCSLNFCCTGKWPSHTYIACFKCMRPEVGQHCFDMCLAWVLKIYIPLPVVNPLSDLQPISYPNIRRKVNKQKPWRERFRYFGKNLQMLQSSLNKDEGTSLLNLTMRWASSRGWAGIWGWRGGSMESEWITKTELDTV